MFEFSWHLVLLSTPVAFISVAMILSLLRMLPAHVDCTSYTERGGRLKLRADASLLLLVMLGLPQWYQDRGESREERAELLAPVAQAIVDATSSQRQRLWLVAQSWHETKFARYVIEDRCKDGPAGSRCDAGRASGPWQVHGWCKDAHDKSLPMVKRFEAGARCALRGYHYGLAQCGGRMAGAFAAQHTALLHQPREQWCTKPWAVRRVATMRQVERKLWAAREVER